MVRAAVAPVCAAGRRYAAQSYRELYIYTGRMQSVQVTDVPSDAQLIDVREPDEFADTHAAGAINLPLSNFAALAEQIDTNQPVYVICRSGGRSVEASQYLEEIFGAEVYNVLGGTQAWVNAGLATE